MRHLRDAGPAIPDQALGGAAGFFRERSRNQSPSRRLLQTALQTAVTVAIQKDRAVLQIVRECGHFCVSVLAPSCSSFLKQFARSFKPEDDPFEGVETALARSGVPYLTGAHAFLECSVLGESTWSDHAIVCGEVVGGACASFAEDPMIHIRKSGSSY